jgi:SAM-dependent methyltransferase
MNLKNIFYPESNFGGFSDIDGVITFYGRVNALVKPWSVILDIGCGRGAHALDDVTFRKNLRIFKDKCKKVIGIDVDPSAQSNPFINEFHLIEHNRWPLPDDSIDICICNSVIEHIEDPDLFFSECRRVLKTGGYLCILTSNMFSYLGILSRIIPNKYHSAILSKIQPKRKDIDIFPTFFKCNTIHKLRNLLTKYCFDNYVYGYEAEPSYLQFSRVLYYLGTIHQKFAPQMIKTTIFAFAQKRF